MKQTSKKHVEKKVSSENSTEQVVKITEAETWVVDNIYLLSGYRKGYDDVKKAFKSILVKHNELMNIWTHLIGALIFILILFYLATQNNLQKFDQDYIQSKIKSMYSSSEDFIGNFDKNIQPFLENMGSVIDSVSVQNLKEYIDKSKSTLQELKTEYHSRIEFFKKNVEEQEIKMINKFGEHFDMYVGKLDRLQEKLKKKYNDFMSSEGESQPTKQADGNEYLKLAVDSLLDTFNSMIPGEGFVNQLFSQMENYLEVYPFFIYLSSVIFCLMSSAIYHWFYTISETIHKFLHKFDMAGISILVFGSSFAVFYYSFYCMPFFRILYSILSFITCFTVFIVSMGDKIHTIPYVKAKATMYASLGISNAFPYLHSFVLFFYSSPENDYLPFNSSIWWLIIMGSIYLGGLTIYTFRIPERFFPKTFDIWLNSHTIWHICVFFAALAHFKTIIIVYNARLQKPCFA